MRKPATGDVQIYIDGKWKPFPIWNPNKVIMMLKRSIRKEFKSNLKGGD